MLLPMAWSDLQSAWNIRSRVPMWMRSWRRPENCVRFGMLRSGPSTSVRRRSPSTRVGHYSPIVTQIIGMTRAYRDHYDSALHTDAAVAAIAEQLRRAANDARRVVTSTTEVRPALTAPLVIITPGPHWILVGALLEDLRRIRLELLDEV